MTDKGNILGDALGSLLVRAIVGERHGEPRTQTPRPSSIEDKVQAIGVLVAFGGLVFKCFWQVFVEKPR